MTTKKKLGQILLEAGVIDEYQLKSALGFQKKWGGRLGSVLVENRFITEEVLVQAIQQQTGIAAVQLNNRNIPDYLTKLVPQELAEQHHLIPIGLEGEAGKPSETLLIATSDPTNLNALDELRFKTGKRVRPVLAGEMDIERAIAVHYRGEPGDGLDFDVDPEGIQFGGPEMDAASLDGDLVLVQGTLESGPGEAGGVAAEDPFADLASLGAPAQAAPQPTPPPPVPAVDDPFAELDALVGTAGPDAGGAPAGQDHPASSALDFDLDISPAGAEGGEPEILDDLEIVEDFEQVDAVPATPPVAPPAAGQQPAAPPPVAQGSDQANPGLFGEPEDLDAMPDLEQPADLSGVPDLEPADPTPVVPVPVPPAATGLDDLPDLEPAVAEEEVPTIQGRQVSPSPFAEDENPGESTADLLMDADDLDLDAVLEPLSGESEGGPPPQAALDGSEKDAPAGGEPVEKEADEQARPKPDSVPTQVISMSDMPADPGPQSPPEAEPAEGADAPPDQPGAEGEADQAPDQAAPDSAAPGAGEAEASVKSDAMKALLSRVGLAKGKPAPADSARPAQPSDANPSAGDPTLAALVRVMIKKGMITAEELQQELEGE